MNKILKLDEVSPLGHGGTKPRGNTGCVIEGTKVKLANGKAKPIEELNILDPSSSQASDRLVTLSGSLVMPVALVAGTETKFPIATIEATHQNCTLSVSASIDHPFLSDSLSIIQPFALRVGDTILTTKGPLSISKITYSEYTGKVWNLVLAHDTVVQSVLDGAIDLDDLGAAHAFSTLGLQIEDHIIITEGFFSGSLVVQNKITEALRRGISLSSIK